MGLEIETSGLRTVSSDLGGAARALSAAAGELAAIGGVAHADLQGGLEALTVAWGTAVEVLGDDVTLVAGQVGDAADLYDTTDAGSARDIRATQPAE